MKPIHPDFSSSIREVPRQLALSQKDLVREHSVSYTIVNRWENSQVKSSRLVGARLDAFCERVQAAGMLRLSEAGRG